MKKRMRRTKRQQRSPREWCAVFELWIYFKCCQICLETVSYSTFVMFLGAESCTRQQRGNEAAPQWVPEADQRSVETLLSSGPPMWSFQWLMPASREQVAWCLMYYVDIIYWFDFFFLPLIKYNISIINKKQHNLTSVNIQYNKSI